MLTPRISVIMPVFNARDHVSQALDSVLSQTCRDFEVVLIDDGSTDGGGEILRGYAERDERIRLFVQQNRGLIETLNRGFALARGEFLARMDADDVSLPERFARQLDYLTEHTDVAGLGCALQYMSDDGLLPRTLRHPTEPEEVRREMLQHSALAHPTVMLRAAAVSELGGYRAAFRHAEDYDLWLRLAERWDLANLPDVLLHYRLHAGQVSMKHIDQQVLSSIGARAAARIRRETGEDPTREMSAMGTDELAVLGVASDEIERALFVDLVFKANHTAAMGLHDEAAALAQRIATRDWPESLRRGAPAELAWIRAKIRLSRGEYVRALPQLARACVSRPGRFLGAVLRRG
ncbi:MAG: glycosyltransferase [bacterium]|nr:glycosyltransferase [bacterium]